jgi:hypothetical protein
MKADTPPWGRVAVRSAPPDARWEQAFQWLDEAEPMLAEPLGPEARCATTQQGDPCPGCMLVCEAAALADGPLSPRESVPPGRLRQLREQTAARRPPVAVVYWPPPPAAWAPLGRCTPPRLQQVEGNARARLVACCVHVRQGAPCVQRLSRCGGPLLVCGRLRRRIMPSCSTGKPRGALGCVSERTSPWSLCWGRVAVVPPRSSVPACYWRCARDS